jgi:hypothetical protein
MKLSSHKLTDNGAVAEADRRREERVPANGEVILAPDGPRPVLIHAQLLDISASGFRACHRSPNLETGGQVRFRHASATGLARVVWNRNSDGKWESGFLILTQ